MVSSCTLFISSSLAFSSSSFLTFAFLALLNILSTNALSFFNFFFPLLSLPLSPFLVFSTTLVFLTSEEADFWGSILVFISIFI
ncbi:unnamed protein product [Moneuplotes crassus]|uniref:Uncharacterized protein n=1 Tax=Euplotes crassus TaxID=5936 RepID=A0AAD2D9P7_EUPCR|nr:unnamed protein product [Moneuplotes crassus]